MVTLKSFLNANRTLVIFLIFYLIIRVIFININYTEWGDTFRMIRGADYLSHFSWPWDEKRWPFYSLLLVPGIWLNNPILWGRILALIVSLLLLVYSYFYYLKNYSTNKNYAILAAVMLSTSSVFAYWSFRVMADLIFAFLILIFNYYFVLNEKKELKVHDYLLSTILLFVTMTRLEGLFMLIGVCSYLFLKKHYRRLILYLLPQVLVYFPWTLYAKVLYKGSVTNDYLEEFSTFSFDLLRFKYFLTYTLFLLVIPVLTALLTRRLWHTVIQKLVFSIKGKINYKNAVKQVSYYFPIYVFITLIVLVGFIWTPSLPRIYLPIIAFFMFSVVREIEKMKATSKPDPSLRAIVYLVIFLMLQYDLKLYFLGASKVLFGLIAISGVIFFVLLMIYSKGYREAKNIFIFLLVTVNLLVTITVIHNQKDIYRSVAVVNEYILRNIGSTDKIAISDETGVSSWYLRDQNLYLPQNKSVDVKEQYQYLKENNVKYLLYTNEFNRGSKFSDPKGDFRYTLVIEKQVETFDLLEDLMIGLGIGSERTEFISKLYRVN